MMPIRDRVQSYRKSLKAHGLKRVELIVPADKEDEVRNFAARLRSQAEERRLLGLRELLREAFRKYGASCLDNIQISFERAGPAEARVVADALKQRGTSEAFLLGRKIASLASQL